MITVDVNGAATTMDEAATVGGLVDREVQTRRGIAVARNGEVVPRSQWDDTPLVDGDRLEILSAAQGG